MSPLKGVAKGNAFARRVATYLGTEVRALCGNKDRGDIAHGVWTLEVKCPGRGQPVSLAGAMREAEVEAVNAGTPDRYAVITRRTGHPTSEAFFTIPLWMAVELGIGL